MLCQEFHIELVLHTILNNLIIKKMKNKLTLLALLMVCALAFTSCDDDESLDITLGFSFTPEENIKVGDTVYFTNNSLSNMDVVYNWDFGDETTSTEESPFHVYTEPGIYDVKLSIKEGQASKSVGSQINVEADLAYIVNYGSYSGDKSTITSYNKYDNEFVNGFYKTINGVDMVSNVQHSLSYEGNIYFMNNNSDGISWVDAKTFEQTENAISTDIVKPRYAVANGNYLYVSCWGGDIWTDETLSYIAKVNLTSKSVEEKIALEGGPEGLAIANNKLYAALNYKDSVAVMDLSSEEFSYIKTPAVTSYFIKDKSENLYVSLVSTYSDPSSTTGLSYINTSTDVLDATYDFPGVSTSYVNILTANDDFSKLYVMTSAYDANWNLSGAVAVFDVATKEFELNNIVEGVLGLNGIAYYNDKVFTFVSESTTSNGKAVVYNTDGTKDSEFETGISPFMLLTVE